MDVTLQAKNIDHPDEQRSFEHGQVNAFTFVWTMAASSSSAQVTPTS
jgi:hypothetical protein